MFTKTIIYGISYPNETAVKADRGLSIFKNYKWVTVYMRKNNQRVDDLYCTIKWSLHLATFDGVFKYVGKLFSYNL